MLMVRRMMVLIALLGACGGDDDKPSRDGQAHPDAGSDSGAVPDAGSAADAAKPNQVTNAGIACRSANGCSGEAPSCQTMLSLLGQDIPFPGGYCSAVCKSNLECGPTGECPVAESLKGLTSIPFLTADLRSLVETAAPSNCYERCTGDDQCRTAEGYRCATIVAALSEGAGQAGLNVGGLNLSTLLSGPIRDAKYCLPPAPPQPDAGQLDAGATDAGQTDAGGTDAGDAGTGAAGDAAQDAAPSDASEEGNG
jgi:hypothetical protein